MSSGSVLVGWVGGGGGVVFKGGGGGEGAGPSFYGCGWLLLVTLPLGGLAVIVWAVWVGVRASRR